ncbi:MAG TPA: hypothetical protein VH600_05855 [Burkholderiales bacterium]|jgi:hypothetical protein
MYSHLARSESSSLFGRKRYQLAARIYATPQEAAVIQYHGLERFEIFYDPARDALEAAATAVHENARTRRLFVTRSRDAFSVCSSEIGAMVAAIRAMHTLNITVSDLLHGITITNRSLREIGELERILRECIDQIERMLRAAQSYSEDTEDLYAPGTDDDDGVPPRDWTRRWRR